MAQPAIQSRENDLLTPAERELVETFRARVRELGLPKLSDAELAAYKLRRSNTEVSWAIEGLELQPVERAFFDMLYEERVGPVSDQLANEFADALDAAEQPDQS